MEKTGITDSFRFNLRNTVGFFLLLAFGPHISILWGSLVYSEDLRFSLLFALTVSPVIWFGSQEYWDLQYGEQRSTEED
ncbi:MAG: hypothetical protein AAGF33_07980 [Pseudomonadota bacterium]